jgi:hypothetical protein
VKEYYGKIEDKMQQLIARERGTSIARSQVSIAVNQGEIAGSQLDINVEQVWDFTIGDSGRNLSKTFAEQPSTCGTSEELQKLHKPSKYGMTLADKLSWRGQSSSQSSNA